MGLFRGGSERAVQQEIDEACAASDRLVSKNLALITFMALIENRGHIEQEIRFYIAVD